MYNNGQGRYAGLGMGFIYGDATHRHAVTSLTTGNAYKYDANRNMIQRVINGEKVALGYDAENRVVKVCQYTSNNGACEAGETVITSFVYDADGRRVKSVIGSETIVFIGACYEITNPGVGQTITKYYFAGAQRVAMRKYVIPSSMAVEYILGDHLGSTSLTTDATGAKISEIRYTAWGEIRYSPIPGASTTPAYKLSPYTFTGQYSYMDDLQTEEKEGFGLMFYNARWYDPYLNHFTQPDSNLLIRGSRVRYDLIPAWVPVCLKILQATL